MSTDELMIIKEGRTVPRKGHIAKRDVLADPIYKINQQHYVRW